MTSANVKTKVKAKITDGVKTSERRQSISVMLPPALMARLNSEAEREDRSRARIIEYALRDWFNQRDAKK